MKIDWDDVIIKILVGLMLAVQLGFSVYAMQSMTPTEKTNFIIQQQQQQLQE